MSFSELESTDSCRTATEMLAHGAQNLTEVFRGRLIELDSAKGLNCPHRAMLWPTLQRGGAGWISFVGCPLATRSSLSRRSYNRQIDRSRL
jgi:hypothetical protein